MKQNTICIAILGALIALPGTTKTAASKSTVSGRQGEMLAKAVGLTALAVIAEAYKPYEHLRDVVAGNKNCYRWKHRELNLSRSNMGISTPLLRPQNLSDLGPQISKKYDELCELSDPNYYASFRNNITVPRPPNTLRARFSPTNFVSQELLWDQEETNAQELIKKLREFAEEGKQETAAIKRNPRRDTNSFQESKQKLNTFFDACTEHAKALEVTLQKCKKYNTEIFNQRFKLLSLASLPLVIMGSGSSYSCYRLIKGLKGPQKLFSWWTSFLRPACTTLALSLIAAKFSKKKIEKITEFIHDTKTCKNCSPFMNRYFSPR